jgi:hypothetical protein
MRISDLPPWILSDLHSTLKSTLTDEQCRRTIHASLNQVKLLLASSRITLDQMTDSVMAEREKFRNEESDPRSEG